MWYCKVLSDLVYFDGDANTLYDESQRKGAQLQQTWPPTHGGAGFAALTALVNLNGDDVMVVAFRGTTGSAEWAEYIKKFGGKLRPIDGGTDRGVYSVWTENLDKMWTKRGSNANAGLATAGNTLTMEDSILGHLRQGKRVWLTGHSKGGAIATTAAARLVCGRASDTFRRQPCRLSIVTFNSPKAFNGRFAEVYEENLQLFGIEHLRIEHKSDVVRHLPFKGLRHVGTRVKVGQSFFNTFAETTVTNGKVSSHVTRSLGVAATAGFTVLALPVTAVLAHTLDAIDLRPS